MIKQDLLSTFLLAQSAWQTPQFVVGIVLLHLVFALLEKNRIESYVDTGEVCLLTPLQSLNHASGYPKVCSFRLDHGLDLHKAVQPSADPSHCWQSQTLCCTEYARPCPSTF